MRNTPGIFESMDYLRRFQGQVMDQMGFGPRETPYAIIEENPFSRLRCYAEGRPGAAALLIVPAPIKAPYIWDLSPERSVVQRAMEDGLGVYMVEWHEPLAGQERGLADYAGPLLDACVDTVTEESGAPQVILAGHSLGGIFSALYAAYRPERVAALLLVDVPLHFPAKPGQRQVPAASVKTSEAHRLPGSQLSMLSAMASPQTFVVERHMDRLASMRSPIHMQTHMSVERWTMDELPMSRKLFDDVITELFQNDGFMQGKIQVGDLMVQPSDISAPVFAVYQSSSSLIPPASVMAFLEAAGSAHKELAAYGGDTGVVLQHVGPLVGDNAHNELWPKALAWLGSVTGRGGEGVPAMPA